MLKTYEDFTLKMKNTKSLSFSPSLSPSLLCLYFVYSSFFAIFFLPKFVFSMAKVSVPQRLLESQKETIENSIKGWKQEMVMGLQVLTKSLNSNPEYSQTLVFRLRFYKSPHSNRHWRLRETKTSLSNVCWIPSERRTNQSTHPRHTSTIISPNL